MPTISVILPILNEEAYIANCLDSILSSDYPKEQMEIFLVDGGSCDATLSIIKEYQKKYSFIKLLHNDKKIVPISMNLGIKAASGAYIIRLDAHAAYPSDYFSKLIEYHQHLDAANVGTCIKTEVKNATPVSNAIKNVLSDKLGVGSGFRSGCESLKEVDTVPFGCFKRQVFEDVGLYDERLIRNQDIELNKRIIKEGGKIYIIPDTSCSYFARESFAALAKNNFENGKWNLLTSYYTKTFSSLSLRHFVPLIFLLSLFMTLLLSIINSDFFPLFLAIFLPYLSIITLRSYQIKKGTTLLTQIAAFFTLHMSYGAGSLFGIFSTIALYIKEKNETI